MDEEAEMLEIWASLLQKQSFRVAQRLREKGPTTSTARAALRAMAAYGDLRARQAQDAMRERCAKVAEALVSKEDDWDHTYWDQAVLRVASAIRSLKDEP